MNQLTIREVQAKDLQTVKEMTDNTWKWSDLLEDDKSAINALITIYINQFLHNSSFGRVAVVNNNVVGVIFGFANGEVPKFRMLQEDAMEHTLALLNLSEEARKNVYECLAKYQNAYRRIISGKEHLYDGQAVFFAVSEEARGLGVGKALWNELKAYFVEKNAKSIYLFSDTDCNFGFYEHNGFTRKDAQEMCCVFTEKGERYEWKVDILLYEYQL